MYFFNIEICAKILTASGTNPQMGHLRWQNVMFSINMIVLAICLIVTLMGLFVEKNISAEGIIGYCESIMTFIHFMVKVGFTFLNKSSIHSLKRSTLAFWNVEELTSESDKKELSTILKYLKCIGIAFIIGTMLGVSGLFVRPLILSGNVLLLEGYVPEDPIFYKLMLYCEYHAVFFFASGIVAVDILFLTLILMAFSQIRMFNRGLGRILSMDVTSLEERRAAKQMMINYIEHHNYILNFLRNVVKTYSTLLLQIILFWIFTNCIEMFSIMRNPTSPEAMSQLFYITNFNVDVIVFYCIPCHILTNEIEDIRATIINSDWIKNVKLFKMEILMILAISNKSKVIVAGNFIEFSTDMFLSAFKTLVSYYMFVINVTQN